MMDKERRNNLRRVINQCRKILEEDVERRLAYYGIMADGTFLESDKLEHLNAEEIEVRKKIELAIQKELVGGLDKKEAVHRYIRHTAFTFLNRIAALRAMEVRGLIKETIIQRSEYGGRSLREREIAEANPSLSPYEILKSALIQAFKEVSQEIKILFDVNSEYSIIFPSEKACRDVIKLLTEDVTENDWKEDDIIGWIYQYFNDEARKEYRKAKRKPKPDDIPVINQFYTPHWIVKALVDNTLGRLWLEMHPESKLGEFCTYMVPLKNGQNKREVKRVREIKVLDPACGSGHFLVYAFDVLYRMYQEDEPNTPASEIPLLILENNLFGIDIDLFSTQLAALSLYLKAKTYNRNLKIRKMNIVCADVRISDGKKRIEFLQRFKDDPDLQEIFAKLFDDLSYTYEIGSLLKIREPFEKLFRERKKGAKQARFALYGQTQLGKEGIVGQAKFVVETSKNSANFVLIIPKERTIEEMIEELRKFEREAIEAHDMGSLLFATEAEKSVGLLALLSEKYDVILMNPPYGDMPTKTKEYLRRCYPKTHFDYYAAFIEQAIELCLPNGFVGMITSRTFMFLKWFEKVRKEILYKYSKPEVLLDLGSHVLDEAIGVWAATTIRKKVNEIKEGDDVCIFFSLTPFLSEEKRISIFQEALSLWRKNQQHNILYIKELKTLKKLPGMPYSYWIPDDIINLFSKHRSLGEIAYIKIGLQTGEDPRFVRYFWEVNPKDIGMKKSWVPLTKGGERFYSDVKLVVYWKNSGQEIKKYCKSSVANEEFYFKKGLCWSRVLSSVLFDARILPEGVIFDINAVALFPKEEDMLYQILAFLNSSFSAFMFITLDPTLHMRQAGYVSRIPVTQEVLNNEKLKNLAKEAHDILQEWDTGDEVSTIFIKPWMLQMLHGFNSFRESITDHPLAQQFEYSNRSPLNGVGLIKVSPTTSIKNLAEQCVQQEKLIKQRIHEIQELIDQAIYEIYDIQKYTEFFEKELKTLRGFPKALKKSYEEAMKPSITIQEHVIRLVSWYIKKVMESDEDGIVTLDELLNKVREYIAQDFGKDRVDKIELEISEILGKSLKEWIEGDYFNFHVSLYRRRPIFWQLTSSRLGKSKLPGVFSCFLYYHKLDRDTIPKILSFYLNPIKERLYRERERIFKELEKARTTGDRKRINDLSKAYEESLNKIVEIENMEKALNILHNPRKDKTKLKPDAKWIEKAIAEVRDNGWNPIIDYGVRVNIEPLKELKILHPAADRVK